MGSAAVPPDLSTGVHDAAVGGDPAFFEELERLKSFPVAWNGPFCKGELARNGFYLSGGKCVCAFCDLELPQGIERGLREPHQEASPNCPYFLSSDVSGNVPLGEATNYRLEKHRLVSFLRTSWTAPVDPYDLAKWGFYWTGSADVGRCTFCRLEVRGWERGDRGQTEHERWNPQCAFIQRGEVGNIPLGQETEEQSLVTGPAEAPRDIGSGGLSTGVHDVAVGGESPLFVEFERLKTFPVAWDGTFRKGDLARNGFYLSGGKCVCAFCKLELQPQRLERELWLLHWEKSPNCPSFLRSDISGNVPLREATNYRLEKHRLVSFLRTSWTFPVDPYDLAKRGFYWTGSADVVRCTFCRLDVRGWERGNGGFSEHSRWNRQCAFLRGQEVGNVPLGEEGNLGTLQTDRGSSQQIEDSINFVGDNPRPSTPQLGIQMMMRAEHAEYSSLAARFNSFDPWPLSMKQRLQELAEAGFFNSGREVRNVRMGEEPPPGPETAPRHGDGPPQTASELGLVRSDPPKHPEYDNMQARLVSYSVWPLSIKQRPKELAEAGFYYTGRGDRVVCFHCGGGLKDWGPTDDPWVEHAVWFYQCSYLVMKMGPDFIRRVQEAQNARDNKPSPPLEPMCKPLKTDEPLPLVAGNEVAPQEYVRECYLCTRCREREMDTLLLGCGHLFCESCVGGFSHCPTCNSRFKSTILVILPPLDKKAHKPDRSFGC